MELSPDIDLVQSINDHTVSWRQGDIVELGAVSVNGAVIPLDELTARQYIDSVPLDLDYLSWP